MLRVLLDVHLSGRSIGEPLRKHGHDVLALDQETALRTLSDDDVLAYAAAQRRIVITFNTRDFAPLCRDWLDMGQGHAGCICLVGIRQSDVGTILRVLTTALAARPQQQDWEGLLLFAGRSAG